MIVHLTGSSWQLREDLPFLRKAAQVIQENDSVLAQDWVETSFQHSERSNIKNPGIDWDRVIHDTQDAISRADVIIIEMTSYRFSQGYQVALALQQKKPTLVISRASHKNQFISGIKSKLLTFADYSKEEELSDIIGKFIHANIIPTKDLRFNFFIDRQIYNYLRSMSYETGMNKSEIIRDLINREIKRKEE